MVSLDTAGAAQRISRQLGRLLPHGHTLMHSALYTVRHFLPLPSKKILPNQILERAAQVLL
jgi:hypothetical protein